MKLRLFGSGSGLRCNQGRQTRLIAESAALIPQKERLREAVPEKAE
jgi:hypothetical protein